RQNRRVRRCMCVPYWWGSVLPYPADRFAEVVVDQLAARSALWRRATCAVLLAGVDDRRHPRQIGACRRPWARSKGKGAPVAGLGRVVAGDAAGYLFDVSAPGKKTLHIPPQALALLFLAV